MDESIQSNKSDKRPEASSKFDAEVHEKLKLNQRESQACLDTYERWLWDVTRYYLGDRALILPSTSNLSLSK